MKILITGARGQLGQELMMQLSLKNADLLGPTSREMDISKIDSVNTVFAAFKPDVVIHCAAFNQVDQAESDPESCRAVNVTGTGNIAELSKAYGAYLLSVSSDYVFDGEKPGEYETDDKKNPISVYGTSKSEGEDIVLAANHENTVIRTSWLFGNNNHNFVEAIIRNGKKSDRISVVGDQIGNPTYAKDLAALIVSMVLKRVPGIYHGTNEGCCSRARFAQEILTMAGIPCSVQEIETVWKPGIARRPKNSRLSKACLDRAGLERLPQWQDALSRYLEQRSK